MNFDDWENDWNDSWNDDWEEDWDDFADCDECEKLGLKKRTPEWAMAVLDCVITTSGCTLEDLEYIRSYSETLENSVYKEIADFYIAVYKDESILYPVKTVAEAEALLEKLTIVPIDWHNHKS